MQRTDFLGIEEAGRVLKKEIIIANDPDLDHCENIIFEVESRVNERVSITETFMYDIKQHDSVSVKCNIQKIEASANVLSQR